MVDEHDSQILVSALGTRLLRISIQYSAGEDRISVDGINAQGQVKRLWLTARIIDRLAPHLLRIAGSPPQVTGLIDTALAQGSEIPKEVEFVKGDEEMLVESVSIRQQNAVTTVIFIGCASTGRASLTLSPDEMLQWINALKNCHLRAGWSVASWDKAYLAMPSANQNNSVTFH